MSIPIPSANALNSNVGGIEDHIIVQIFRNVEGTDATGRRQLFTHYYQQFVGDDKHAHIVVDEKGKVVFSEVIPGMIGWLKISGARGGVIDARRSGGRVPFPPPAAEEE